MSHFSPGKLRSYFKLHDSSEQKLIEEALLSHLDSTKAKITPEGAKLLAEHLRLFTQGHYFPAILFLVSWIDLEAILRASVEAKASGDSEVDPSHLENIMAGLMMDF